MLWRPPWTISSRPASWRADLEALRIGLEQLIDRYRRQRIGASIVSGYQAHPQDDDDLWADEDTRRMIEEEPW